MTARGLCYRQRVMNRGKTGWLASLALCGLMACEPKVEGAEGPSETLRAYAAALRQGNAEVAYQLLSDEAKRNVSREAFGRMVKENPEDVKDIAQSLSRPSSKPVVTALVTAPSGDQLTLLYEGGRWTVDGTGIDRYGQSTPRQAIKGFLRAYDRQRFDVLMRYVPAAEREGSPEAMWGPDGQKRAGGLTADKLKEAWTGEQKEYIAAIVQAIKTALPNAKIEETDDRAAMPYGAGGTVLFIRENGLWKIDDLR